MLVLYQTSQISFSCTQDDVSLITLVAISFSCVREMKMERGGKKGTEKWKKYNIYLK